MRRNGTKLKLQDLMDGTKKVLKSVVNSLNTTNGRKVFKSSGKHIKLSASLHDNDIYVLL